MVKRWKNIVAVAMLTIMVVTMPGFLVLADELSDGEVSQQAQEQKLEEEQQEVSLESVEEELSTKNEQDSLEADKESVPEKSEPTPVVELSKEEQEDVDSVDEDDAVPVAEPSEPYMCDAPEQASLTTFSGGIASYSTGGLNVEYRSINEIKAFLNSNPASLNDRTSYKVQPSTRAPYALGELSSETTASALNMLNQMRYIAGLPGNVVIDNGYQSLAQAATVVNAANGVLTHYPSQPAGMDYSMYELGARGAASSNLAAGFASLNRAMVQGYMNDGDSSNIDRVGHRRWVLNPTMGKIGFGATNAYYSMYAFDRSASSSYSKVSWPAQNMPLEYWGNSYPWSNSIGRVVNASAVSVRLRRVSDNKVWNFSQGSSDGYFNVDNGGYGTAGCIIFRPANIEYSVGDSFEVTISGVESQDIKYTVNFFRLVEIPITDFMLYPSAPVVGVGKTQTVLIRNIAPVETTTPITPKVNIN